MNTILRRLRRSDAGVAMLMVMGWGLVLAMLVSAGIGYAIQSNLVAHRGQDWGSALSAAQAGLEDYVARLNRNDNYGRTWDCTNVAMRGPNEPGNTCGWTASTAPGWIPVVGSDPTAPSFHYDVDATNLDKNGTIRVVSTGRDGKESRTVEAAIGRGFRRGVQDRRRARGAGLAAVADAGQRQDAALDQGRRRLHVDDLGAAGIADRAGAAHEQDAMLVDIERGIVDPRVIILRALEHDGAALERVGIFGIDQITVAEFL